MAGKGWKAERLLCSLSGCLSGSEEPKILLGSSTQCLLLALSEYKCLFFTELQGNWMLRGFYATLVLGP